MTVTIRQTMNGNWEVSGASQGPIPGTAAQARVFKTKSKAKKHARKVAKDGERIVADVKGKVGQEVIRQGR